MSLFVKLDERQWVGSMGGSLPQGPPLPDRVAIICIEGKTHKIQFVGHVAEVTKAEADHLTTNFPYYKIVQKPKGFEAPKVEGESDGAGESTEGTGEDGGEGTSDSGDGEGEPKEPTEHPKKETRTTTETGPGAPSGGKGKGKDKPADKKK